MGEDLPAHIGHDPLARVLEGVDLPVREEEPHEEQPQENQGQNTERPHRFSPQKHQLLPGELPQRAGGNGVSPGNRAEKPGIFGRKGASGIAFAHQKVPLPELPLPLQGLP